MIWNICFALSVIILLAAVLYSVVAAGKYKSDRILTSFNSIFAGIFIAVFVSLIPVFQETLAGEYASLCKLIAYDFLETLQVFTINVEAGDIISRVIDAPTSLNGVYSIYMSFLFVAAPLMTFGFLFSLFQNFMNRTMYLLHFGDDCYIFSELNERSLMLAKSIRKNHADAQIIFTDVDKEEGDVISEQVEAAKELKAILFRKDILSVDFSKHSKNAELFFFTLSMNEEENVIMALKILEKYGERDKTDLYVFSTGTEGEILLANAPKGKIKVRRIDDVRSLVYRFLYDEGQTLFENAGIVSPDEKSISAVIIGLGKYGTEMAKALSWYCQMDGYSITINAFDIDELAEEKFAALCPELMSEHYNGVSIPGESCYTIHIHSGIDVRTRTFAEELTSIKDVSFVLVCLGNDERNINQAVNIRMLCERMGAKPVIRTVLYSSVITDSLANAVNYRGQAYQIESIGNLESFYSEEILMGSELEKLALKRHLAWGEEEEFWQYEYNYRSSMASAVHAKARIYCHIPGADVEESNLTPEERHTLEQLEHKRWNAYMRSEGYVYSGSPLKTSRNDLAKMHHDLVDYESLTEEEKRKDSKVGAKM